MIPAVVFGQTKSDTLGTYFNALRERGLFTIAEEYALARLSDPRVEASDRIRVSKQLAETLCAHGATTFGQERQELWARWPDVLAAAASNIQHPTATLLLDRTGRILQAREARTLAGDLELVSASDGDTQAVIERLRTSIAGLQDLENPFLRPRNGESPWLKEFAELSRELSLLRVENTLLLAELLPAGPDRAAAFISAEKLSSELKSALRDSLEEAKLDLLRIRLARRQANSGQALLLVNSLLGRELPAPLRDAAIAEKGRILLEQGKTDEALAALAERLRQPGSVSDELRAVAVEVLLEARGRAIAKNNLPLTNDLLQEALRQQQAAGGRWRLWIDHRLQVMETESRLGKELAAIVQRGQHLYESGNLADAAREFDAASRMAQQRHLEAEAEEFALNRASLLYQARDWEGAAAAFQSAIERFPASSRHGETSLLRCYALGQAAAVAGKDQTLRRSTYEQALRQHVQQFPGLPESQEARLLLADLLIQTGKKQEALAVAQQIPGDDPQRPAARRRQLTIAEQWASSDNNTAEGNAIAAQEVAVRIGRELLLPETVPAVEDVDLMIRAARLLLEQGNASFELCEQLLDRAQAETAAALRRAQVEQASIDPAWQAAADAIPSLRVLSLAGQGNIDDARIVLTRLQQSGPHMLLTTLVRLTELSRRSDLQLRQRLAALQRQATEEILSSRSQLSEADQRLLDECAVEAYRTSGRYDDALRILESLVRAHPQESRYLRQFAEVLRERNEPADLPRQRTLWQQLEQRSTPGSVDWVEARLRLVEVLSEENDRESARKLLGVTRTLYPTMGNESLRKRGEELWGDLSPVP